MITPRAQENINTKIEQAKEAAKSGFKAAEKYTYDNNSKYLGHMGSYLGTCLNNLRSALNYAVADYSLQRGFVAKKNDFPYSYEKDKFEKINLVIFMRKTDLKLYDFIEGIQPYHESNWLGTLMNFSNKDKHEDIIAVENANIQQFIMLDQNNRVIPNPKHMGSHVLIPSSDNKSVTLVPTPCYIEQMRVFALPNGKWMNFFIRNSETSMREFLPLLTSISARVHSLIEEFSESF